MVASIATAATAAYYMESQQSYRHPNNYYIGGKEPDGRWWNPHGLFGLSDNENIDPREFHRIYSGLDPATSEKLTRLAGNDKRTAGFDLTFSPDKSVSALWAVADQDLRTKIEAAQQEAVRFTLDFIVRGYCSHTRIRHPDGQLEVVPGDLMAATFQHGSSRANDPQLHTHSVIFNLVKTHHDKKFRALHARPLFSWKMAAGSVYRTALAWNLQQSIGVKMEQYGRNQDLTRIAGMPDALIKEWSTRRNQIENFAQMLGFETGTNAARAAAINKLTRNAKDNDPDADGQFERWQAEARILVPELEQTIAAAIGRDITIGPEHHTSLEDVLAQLPEKLTSHEAVIALPLIVEKVANATASLTSPQVLQSYIDRGLKIIWAGDTQQQQPVEAGPGLRLVREATGSIRIDKIRRQQADIEDILVHQHGATKETARLQMTMMSPADRQQTYLDFANLPADQKATFTPWMVKASEAFRDGQISDAIAAYRERGHFHLCRNLPDTAKQLVDDWHAYHLNNPGKSTLVLAQTRKDVAALSHLIRERIHAGSDDTQHAIVHVCRGKENDTRLTPLEIRRGDRLRIGTTNWTHNLFNGDVVTVDDFKTKNALLSDKQRILITGHTEYGRKITFHHDEIKDYFGDIRLDHGFAVTMTSGQGATVDHTFVYADTKPAAETIYPAATRHREGLDIYVNRQATEIDVIDYRADNDRDQDVTDDEIVDHLTKRWSRSNPKTAAQDHASKEVIQQTLDLDNPNDKTPPSTDHDRSNPPPSLAANDNRDGVLKNIARNMHENALEFRYGSDIEAIAIARTEVLASYEKLSMKTRDQDIAYAAGEAFTETLSRHGHVLEQAKIFRKNPLRFTSLLARRGGINFRDLNEFEKLHNTALNYQRQHHRERLAMKQQATQTQAPAIITPIAETISPATAQAPAPTPAETQTPAATQRAETTSPAATQASAPTPAETQKPKTNKHKPQTQHFPRAADLSLQLAAQTEEVCRHYLPAGTKAGRFWQAGNTHGETGQSLFVHLTGPSKGKWRDAATDQSGDLLDLIKATQQYTKTTDAMDEARRFLGTNITPITEIKQRQATPTTATDRAALKTSSTPANQSPTTTPPADTCNKPGDYLSRTPPTSDTTQPPWSRSTTTCENFPPSSRQSAPRTATSRPSIGSSSPATARSHHSINPSSSPHRPGSARSGSAIKSRSRRYLRRR